MSAITFDTHEFIKKFCEKGLNEDLAEYQVEVIKGMVNQAVSQVKHDYELDSFVTNKDLDARIKETELKIELVKAELKRDIESVRKEMAENKAELVRWVVGVGLLQITIIAGLMFRLTGKM